MDSASSQSKKRKRQSDTDGTQAVKISIASTSSDVGPVLAVFPAVQPPPSTSFQLYREKPRLVAEGSEPHHILKGSTEAIEYFSASQGDRSNDDITAQYLVGIYDKTTHEVKLYRAPTHLMSRTVKALKGRTKSSPTDQTQYRLARNNLGETFGSKKAIKAIRAAERNQVDVSALQGVVSHVQNEIDVGTSALPSQAEITASMADARPIPPVNENAAKASDVYDIFDVVPEAELKAISIQPYILASSTEDRKALLPERHSRWVGRHLNNFFSTDRIGKLDKPSLKLVIVVSSMLAFRRACQTLLHKTGPDNQTGRDLVEERLKSVPDLLRDGLFERFTEHPRGNDQPKYTSACDTRLLTYMFSLVLRVDRWKTHAGWIADDLKMDSPRYHSLLSCCQRETLTPDQRKALNITAEKANEQKTMVLKLPLVFPAPPRRRKGQ
ncbi:RNA polymerase I associated factor, A49-like protein [Clavulina sp. PMI_390]|nr:RNA polymerase I associated factor, A49-like protein [Clavulina sp. PMI_390]